MVDVDCNGNPVIDNIPLGYIAPSTVHGMGLFARRPVPAGAVLGALDGQVVSWEDYKLLRDRAPSGYPGLFFEWNALAEDTLLVRPLRTKYSYINHSREPNLVLRRHPLRIEALRDVNRHEEFLLDYRAEPLNEEYLNGHGKTYL